MLCPDYSLFKRSIQTINNYQTKSSRNNERQKTNCQPVKETLDLNFINIELVENVICSICNYTTPYVNNLHGKTNACIQVQSIRASAICSQIVWESDWDTKQKCKATWQILQTVDVELQIKKQKQMP